VDVLLDAGERLFRHGAFAIDGNPECLQPEGGLRCRPFEVDEADAVRRDFELAPDAERRAVAGSRTDGALRLRERPLLVMEGALLDNAGLTHGRAREVIARLRDRTRAAGGEFTVLWLNSALLSRRDRDLYSGIMAAP
jgi:hypothetical protein